MDGIKEVSVNELEQITGGTGSYPPLPARMKNTLSGLVPDWKRQGYSLDRAVQAARSVVGAIYAAEAEEYVRGIWPNV